MPNTIINVLPGTFNISDDPDKRLAAILTDNSVCIILDSPAQFLEKTKQKTLLLHWQAVINNDDPIDVNKLLINMLAEAVRKMSPRTFQTTILFSPDCKDEFILWVKSFISTNNDVLYNYDNAVEYNEITEQQSSEEAKKVNLIKHLKSFMTVPNKIPTFLVEEKIQAKGNKDNLQPTHNEPWYDRLYHSLTIRH
jgi:hypothetical protein